MILPVSLFFVVVVPGQSGLPSSGERIGLVVQGIFVLGSLEVFFDGK